MPHAHFITRMPCVMLIRTLQQLHGFVTTCGSSPLGSAAVARSRNPLGSPWAESGMRSCLNGFRNLHLAPPFLVEDYVPVAQTTYRLGRMKGKVEQALKELENCVACPRRCGVNRMQNRVGQCMIGRKAVVTSVFPHFGEEGPLQGWSGSGTLFFGMCNLKCVFCQNWDISQREHGTHMTAQEMADWMLKLQDEGRCHNINFVTPEHVVPQVVEAIAVAVEKGLTLPIVYNTSAYDSLDSLRLMDGLVDIYMPDFKFWTPESSWRYTKARDYAEHAKLAIQEMYRQVGDLAFDTDGLARRGLLVRHLVMPALVHEGKSILRWIRDHISMDCYVNIMEQYRPDYKVGKGELRTRIGFTKYDELDRPVTSNEVKELRDYAASIGLWRFEEPPRYESVQQQQQQQQQ